MALVLVLVLLLAAGTTLSGVRAADPDPVFDLCDPEAPVAATFNGLPAPAGTGGMVQRLNAATFPALTGQGQSFALLTFKPCSQNPPHTHPRGSELLYIIEGQVTVMLIDTSLRLRTSTLKAGDVALNPRGLLHFETNFDTEKGALVLATFNSQNPGTLVSNIPARFCAVFVTDLTSSRTLPMQPAATSLFRTPFDVLQFTLGLSQGKLEKLNSTLPTGFPAGDRNDCRRAQNNYPLTFPNGYHG